MNAHTPKWSNILLGQARLVQARAWCALVLFLFFSTVFLRESAAEIFAWEYNKCLQGCTPKEACCAETCGYRACIKQHTTRETSVGAELTDPGAGDAAIAVCAPHLDVMNKCFKANPSKPPDDLDTARDTFCALAIIKTKSYANKDACLATMMASEKRGGMRPDDILKAYQAGIATFRRK